MYERNTHLAIGEREKALEGGKERGRGRSEKEFEREEVDKDTKKSHSVPLETFFEGSHFFFFFF